MNKKQAEKITDALLKTPRWKALYCKTMADLLFKAGDDRWIIYAKGEAIYKKEILKDSP